MYLFEKKLIEPPNPIEEAKRLVALHKLQILDTPPEECFDRIVRTASRSLNVSYALISLMDSDRQWFKACYGLQSTETPRAGSFCEQTILSKETLVVTDTLLDPRFVHNILVTEEPHLRFYAGHPLYGPEEQLIGTLCVLDSVPREFSPEDEQTLRDLAAWVQLELNNMQIARASELIQQAQEKLKDSNYFIERIVKATPNIIYVYDLIEQRNVYSNIELPHMLGYSPEQTETIGLNSINSLVHPEDLPRFLENYSKFKRAKEGDILEIEYRVKNAVGEWRWLYSRETLFSKTPDGKPRQILGMVEDVTERKLAEEALWESEGRFRQLADNINQVFWLFNLFTGEFIYVSPAYETIFGLSRESLQTSPKSYLAAIHPEDLPEITDWTEKYLYNSKPLVSETTFEFRLYRPDGSLRWVWGKASPVHNEYGQAYRVAGFLEDITERKAAEAALFEQKEFSANLLKFSAVATIVIDSTHKVVVWNKAAEELTGYFAREMVGTSNHWKAFYDSPRPTLDDIVVDGNFEELPELFTNYSFTSTLAANAIHAERWFQDMNGKNRYVVFDTSPVYNTRGDIIAAVTTLQDFTEREQVEDALRRSVATNRALLNAIPDLMLRINGNGVFVNYKAAKDYNLPVPLNKLLGKNVYDVFNPELASRFLYHIHETLDNHVTQIFEYQLSQADIVSEYEVRLGVSADDEVLALVRDITERKKIDRMKNEFVSIVSHELRTPLTSIRGALGLIVGGVAGDISQQASAMIDIAHKNSERLVRMINDILDIEKIESGKMTFNPKVVDLTALVEQSLEANRLFAQQYGVTFQLENSLPGVLVYADADGLMQVMANLLSNAAKFSPAYGEVRVRLYHHKTNLVLAVSDDGPGVPEEFHSHIFQKFAQADSSATRQKGGSGLGLSIAKAIVERNGGKIGYETRRNKGSTFYFTLPEYHAEENPLIADNPEVTIPIRPVNGQLPRILHVENDEDVCRVVSAILRNVGLVLQAHTLQEARYLLEKYNFSLVIFDLNLPDGSGLELLEQLKQKPDGASIPTMIFSATEVNLEVTNNVQVALVKSITSNQQLLNAVNSLIGRADSTHMDYNNKA